jgi:hypothetical protein
MSYDVARIRVTGRGEDGSTWRSQRCLAKAEGYREPIRRRRHRSNSVGPRRLDASLLGGQRTRPRPGGQRRRRVRAARRRAARPQPIAYSTLGGLTDAWLSAAAPVAAVWAASTAYGLVIAAPVVDDRALLLLPLLVVPIGLTLLGKRA